MGVLLSSSLGSPGLVVFTCATHPNVRWEETSGLRPCQASNGITPSSAYVGEWFKMNTTVLTASPQNAADTFIALSMLRTMPSIVWLHRSTTPFCYGVYGAVR